VSWEVMAETLGMPPNARRKSFTKIEQMQGVESNAAALVSLQVGDTEEKARFGDTLNVDSTPETTKANLYRQASSIKAMEKSGVAFADTAKDGVAPTHGCCVVQ